MSERDWYSWNMETDTGCVESPTCGTCPLVRCRFDDSYGYMSYKAAQVSLTWLHRLDQTSLMVKEVALEFKVDPRSVWRARQRRPTLEGIIKAWEGDPDGKPADRVEA